MAHDTKDQVSLAYGRSPDPPLPNIRVPLIEIEPGVDWSAYQYELEHNRAVVCDAYLVAVRETNRAVIIPDKTMSPAISAHGVGFGLLEASHSSYPVALKPFDRPANALHEVWGYQLLRQLGVETYTALGVFPAAERGRWVVVTETREDLVSLDRDEWIEGRRPKSENEVWIAERNSHTIRAIATLMAYAHSVGTFHPDGQIKNWAKTPEGRVGIIDTENLVQIDLDDESAATRAWSDVEKLVRSLIAPRNQGGIETILGVGMLHGLSLRETRAAIHELIVEPYLESLVVQLGNSSPVRTQFVQHLYDGLVERFESSPNWPEHFISGYHR